MRSRLVPLVCFTITLASIPVAAQSPNPNAPYILSITYGGSGCPQGSVGNSFSSDRKSFTLIFDQFVASSGPGVPATENRKNCQLNVNVRVPQGSGQFCASVDYRGYVSLPSGVTAEQKATYYYQGNSYVLPDGQEISVGEPEEIP